MDSPIAALSVCIIDTYVNKSALGDKCILYTEAQTLTDEQQAQARENIGVVGTGEDGAGWYPAEWKARFLEVSPAELFYDIKVGDYLVQTNDDTSLESGGTTLSSLGRGAVWKVTMKMDSSTNKMLYAAAMGFTIRGAKGEDADPNSVLYVAQTLTDEQKAQARTNIGAIAADEAQVPVASETQFGTIKCWVDSAGYLCISTE